MAKIPASEDPDTAGRSRHFRPASSMISASSNVTPIGASHRRLTIYTPPGPLMLSPLSGPLVVVSGRPTLAGF